MTRLLAKSLLGTILFIPAATGGYADTLLYNFVTSNTPYGIISTTLPASPAPISFTLNSFDIGIVPIALDGDVTNVLVRFYTAAEGGGASGFFDGDLYRYDGPPLFSGSTNAPTFLTGVFPFGDFSLTITPGITDEAEGRDAIPEPSTLILFGIGMLVGGGLLRRRLSGSWRANIR
jgi:hypothetical protein